MIKHGSMIKHVYMTILEVLLSLPCFSYARSPSTQFCHVSKLQEMDMDLASDSMFEDRAEPNPRLASIKLSQDLLPINLYRGKEKKFSACLEQT